MIQREEATAVTALCPKCRNSANVNEKPADFPTRFRCNACQFNFNDGLSLHEVDKTDVAIREQTKPQRPSLLKRK